MGILLRWRLSDVYLISTTMEHPIFGHLEDPTQEEYIKALEEALIFMCSAYSDCMDTYRKPSNFKTDEEAMHSIMMFPLIQ